MYSSQELSRVRRQFWTSFGQYMRPLADAAGEPVNWINYKTGIRHLYFRMDVDRQQAMIAIEMRQPDPGGQQLVFEKFLACKSILHQALGEDWDWQLLESDEDGKPVSRISKKLPGVNIFRLDDWPTIISFLKPRIIALDQFWHQVKDQFD